MSGGHFDYNQYIFDQVSEQLEHVLDKEWFATVSPETRARVQEAIISCKISSILVNRIDWFVSGDDSEETFHRRLTDELMEAAKKYPRYFGLDNESKP